MTEIEDLTGLITAELGWELRRLASDVPAEQAIVEIGSFKGKSTCCLALGAEFGLGAHVWAVDPWDTPGNVTGRFGFAEPSTREAFEQQVADAGMDRRITQVKGFSTDAAAAWDGPEIGLLYIDGDHSEEVVRDDFYAWKPHLATGATVAFDDLDTPKNPGVRVVVDELCRSGEVLDLEVRAERLAVCRVTR